MSETSTTARTSWGSGGFGAVGPVFSSRGSGCGSSRSESRSGFCTLRKYRPCARSTSTCVRATTHDRCRLPIGAMSTISPSTSSTLSSSPRTPASPMARYSLAVNLCLLTSRFPPSILPLRSSLEYAVLQTQGYVSTLAFTRSRESELYLLNLRQDKRAGNYCAPPLRAVLRRFDRVGQGSEALYLDRDLISCLQPHLRVAGRADAWWRTCDYHIAWDEGHTLGEKGDELGDREDHLRCRPILHDFAV